MVTHSFGSLSSLKSHSVNLPPGTFLIKNVNSFLFSFCGADAKEYDLGRSNPGIYNSAHIPANPGRSLPSGISLSVPIVTDIISVVSI